MQHPNRGPRGIWQVFLIALFMFPLMGAESTCENSDAARVAEENAVGDQQLHYLDTQPIPYFDFSMQRDVYIQIYDAANSARNTFTVVESVTGITKWACPSVGYPIPTDVSLTNPLQRVYGPTVVEQAEPNGLYSSKNTDGTWILCVLESGEVAPVYTEHKATAFPFFIDGVVGEWSQQPGSTPSSIVTISEPDAPNDQ